MYYILKRKKNIIDLEILAILQSDKHKTYFNLILQKLLFFMNKPTDLELNFTHTKYVYQ